MKKILFVLSMLFGVCQAQMTLNSDVVIASQRSVDGKQYKLVGGKHVPYTSASEVLSMIPSTRRHVGQIFYVAAPGRVDVYQFTSCIADTCLKIRQDTLSLGPTMEFTGGLLQVKIQTGTAPPTTTPTGIGLIFIDTTNKIIYMSVGTSSSDDWQAIQKVIAT